MKIHYSHQAIIAGLLTTTASLLIGGLQAINFFPQIAISSTILYFIIFKNLAQGGSIFHPAPLVALIMIWSLAISPLASIVWGKYILYVPKNIEWEPWLIYTSWVYTACTIALLTGISLTWNEKSDPLPAWEVNRSTLPIISLTFLAITLLIQAYIFMSFGGIYGYLVQWTEQKESFKGLGSTFMLAEAFPILLLISFVLFTDREKVREKIGLIYALLIIFFLLKLLFGGFRGSRSNTIWGIFWAAGIIHLVYFKLKLRHYLIGLAFLLSFMVSYAVYKSFGVEAFSGEYTVEDSGRFDGNPVAGILLEDFSRSTVHAYTLHEYFDSDSYNVKLGATYLNSLFKMLPWMDNPFPDSKNTAGAELFYGRTIDPVLSYGRIRNSRVFGLYGEGLLNFGPALPILLFIGAGVLIGKINNFCLRLQAEDPRTLLIPFIANGCLVLILSDSDNLVFFIMKNGFMAFLMIFLISMRPKPITSMSQP
ncbi:hypothetical protein KRX52_09185 [Pseudomonas sp. MAP12]|uniref:Oligosaccharide repeat unit polymerase n=1 Tax=Geopseudomonas aromaticivorans TaxID=2849492 RepID=A0ABS6MVZ8_9GAMM|nr:hypothetical protein [Pseudomonas aromaticivorans]MBV2132974.1 hypothetical protein [Pseudomonas aromaticivorans]